MTSLGGLVHILKAADPTDKLEVYRQLGLKLTYDHKKRVVVAEAAPQPPVCVLSVSGGGLGHANWSIYAHIWCTCGHHTPFWPPSTSGYLAVVFGSFWVSGCGCPVAATRA